MLTEITLCFVPELSLITLHWFLTLFASVVDMKVCVGIMLDVCYHAWVKCMGMRIDLSSLIGVW